MYKIKCQNKNSEIEQILFNSDGRKLICKAYTVYYIANNSENVLIKVDDKQNLDFKITDSREKN